MDCGRYRRCEACRALVRIRDLLDDYRLTDAEVRAIIGSVLLQVTSRDELQRWQRAYRSTRGPRSG